YCQRFRVPDPFLAERLIHRVSILDFPFDVSKGNPAAKTAGILLLLPAAIPIQGSGQRGDVLLPLQRPHVFADGNAHPVIRAPLLQEVDVPAGDPAAVMLDPEAKFPAP